MNTDARLLLIRTSEHNRARQPIEIPLSHVNSFVNRQRHTYLIESHAPLCVQSISGCCFKQFPTQRAIFKSLHPVYTNLSGIVYFKKNCEKDIVVVVGTHISDLFSYHWNYPKVYFVFVMSTVILSTPHCTSSTVQVSLSPFFTLK